MNDLEVKKTKWKLNPKQKEAVFYNEGHLEIIAGAGTGKTKTLTSKIAYLLNDLNVLPWSILALTFTNKAARDMRKRVEELIGKTVKEFHIKTFHSWCFWFLNIEHKKLGFESLSVISASTNYQIVKDIFNEVHKVKKSENSDSEKQKTMKTKVNHLINYIEKRKKNGVYGKDNLIFKTKKDHFDNEVFIKFNKYLKTNNLLTFQDLLLKTYLALKDNSEIREKWTKKYHYILVDEFQDTDNIQYEIIKLLSSKAIVTIVGDPDQLIYGWRGAEVKIILNFHKDFINTKRIILDQNYRSTAQILELGNNLILKNQDRVEKKLLASKQDGNEVVIKKFELASYEAEYVAQQILILQRQNVKLSDIAILFRSNFVSSNYETYLRRKNIAYVLRNAVNFFDRKEIKVLLNLLNVIDKGSDFYVESIINFPNRGIGPKTLEKIKNEAFKNEQKLIDFIFSDEIEAILNKKSLNSLRKLFIVLREAEVLFIDTNHKWSDILNRVLKKINIFEYIKNSNKFSEDAENNVESLFKGLDDFQRDEPDAFLGEYLASTSLYNKDEDDNNSDKVNLMTVHSAKGLEFDHVFIVSFIDGIFPTIKSMLTENETFKNKVMEEERRLAHVAITRAKQNLWITYYTEKSYFTNGFNARPSRFLKETSYKKTKTKSGFSRIIKSKAWN